MNLKQEPPPPPLRQTRDSATNKPDKSDEWTKEKQKEYYADWRDQVQIYRTLIWQTIVKNHQQLKNSY